MWTPVSGCQHSRKHLRYGSDLTDAEWAIMSVKTPEAGGSSLVYLATR